ncbi:MAG: 30S ribosomal protein S12 methylthiotransferase RimO [bacterium]
MKVNLISLGCPKNLVDSEVILGRLGERGYSLTSLPEEADVVVVNTCSFIDKARREANRVISQVASQKRSSQKLIICGCLPQLEGRSLFRKYPQIDALLGTSDFPRIDKVLTQLFKGKKHFYSINEPCFLYSSNFPRLLTTPPSYAYLKIAEGCSNRCSYCLVPRLRGRYRSRPVEDVLREAKALAYLDVRELILIAQDTTFYGWDLGRKSSLLLLLEGLEKIERIQWIRLLYTHPDHFTSSLIKKIANSEKICKYIDLPLQHTHDEILALMGRPKFKTTERLIEILREKIPEIALRTSVMVGFPGEKAQHFDKLLKDVERLKFDWLGAFTYSPEKGTPAYSLTPKISSYVKEKRYRQLMRLQQSITLKLNQKRVNKTYRLLVDAEKEGHCQFQAPEIDGKTFLQEPHLAGEIFRGRILEVKNFYDLIGKRENHGL